MTPGHKFVVDEVFSKKGNPTLETLQAILEALGLRVTVVTAA